MSYQSPLNRDALKGAAKVGSLQSQDMLGQVVVRLFRGAAPQEVDPQVIESFDHLFDLISRYARRPFIAHGASCDCLGADEAVLIELIRLAGQGEREDCLMLAMLIVRGDLAPMLASQAQSFAMALARDLGRHRTQTHPVSARVQ